MGKLSLPNTAKRQDKLREFSKDIKAQPEDPNKIVTTNPTVFENQEIVLAKD
jgi:hypothetical protein